MPRFLKFNAVGLLGIPVQLAALALYSRLLPGYLLATALAVETAVLHNFAWHVHWTWRDTPGHWPGRLLRFHLANGLVSVVGNVALMRLFRGAFGWPLLAANLAAIAVCALVNYGAAELWVFARRAE